MLVGLEEGPALTLYEGKGSTSAESEGLHARDRET